VIELTKEREVTKPKGVRILFRNVDLVPEVSFVLFCSKFEVLLLPVETLRGHVIGSFTDMKKLSIELIVRGFKFKGERMGVMGFLNFFPLGIHVFTLRLIFYQVHFGLHFKFGFGVDTMLIFNTNHLKSLDQS